MTANQRRAIEAIGRRLDLDVVAECREAIGQDLDDLDVPGASRFIDHLKALQACAATPARARADGTVAGNRNGNGRNGVRR
jgi:hypothetical protein